MNPSSLFRIGQTLRWHPLSISIKHNSSAVTTKNPSKLLLRHNTRLIGPICGRISARLISSKSSSYQAALVTELGKPLEIKTLEAETLPEGCVRMDVHNASINFGDILMVQGKYQVRPPLPFSPGTECAGVVMETGKNVDHLQIGDRVFGFAQYGTFSEQVVLPSSTVYKVPPEMSSEVACGLMAVYGTAMASLKRRVRIKPGDTVLVTSAAGGVGLAAVDLAANYFNAKVIGACSTDEKCKVAASKGASATINYNKEKLSERVKELTDGRGADIIVDNVGGEQNFKECLKSVAFEGRILVIGFTSGEIPKIPANILLLKSCSVVGVYWGNYQVQHPTVFKEYVKETLEAVVSGKANPHISKVYPLSQVNEALNSIANRKSTGKLVLDCRSERD